jgi:transcriptional regulator with XRE-family HTH domain
MKNILDDLRSLRIEQSLSQEDLAERLGLQSQSGFSRLERGFHSPTLVTLSNWADALGHEIVLQKKGEQ